MRIYNILICLLCCSCSNDTNQVKRNSNGERKDKDTIQVSKRDIHDIDKLERYSKIEEERQIDPELLTLWNRFIKIAANKNYSELIYISLDTIEGCDAKYETKDFIQRCLPDVIDTTLLKRFSEISYSKYTEHEVISSYMPQFLLKEMNSVGDPIKLNQFQVLKELTPDGGWTMTFDFVKTKNGYKFLGCDSFGGPICCR